MQLPLVLTNKLDYMYNIHCKEVYIQIFKLKIPLKMDCNFDRAYLPLNTSKLYEIAIELLKNNLTVH